MVLVYQWFLSRSQNIGLPGNVDLKKVSGLATSLLQLNSSSEAEEM